MVHVDLFSDLDGEEVCCPFQRTPIRSSRLRNDSVGIRRMRVGSQAGLHAAENPTSLRRRGVFRQYPFRERFIVGKGLLHRARVQHFVNQHRPTDRSTSTAPAGVLTEGGTTRTGQA